MTKTRHTPVSSAQAESGKAYIGKCMCISRQIRQENLTQEIDSRNGMRFPTTIKLVV